MLFNTLDFAIFLPVVLTIYWLLGRQNIRSQNVFLILASYYFYAHWDWRFLILIIFSSTLDYLVGLGFLKYWQPGRRKLLLILSLAGNLGLLFYFKYFNFFIDAFVDTARLFGAGFNHSSLSIILPVGISFYTFQTLSYTIDIYNNKFKPTKDGISFFAFVSFFPQLVAGPIERARKLLPQFQETRSLEVGRVKEGLYLILWGLFKKIVIADNCAMVVNQIFANSDEVNGSTLLIGTLLFMFQLYTDFSGYSDIAIGSARLFGFNLSQNFAYPYFARDVAETWSRWHISLTTWFRDYLYIPLTIGRNKTWYKVLITFVVFGLCGLWHGAYWTFLIWGLLFGLTYSKHVIFKRPPRTTIVAEGKYLPSLTELRQMITTFISITIPCVFFRADSVGQAMDFFKGIFSMEVFQWPEIMVPIHLVILIPVFFIIEWLGRTELCPLTWFRQRLPASVRWGMYYAIIFLMFYYDVSKEIDFIYFQF